MTDCSAGLVTVSCTMVPATTFTMALPSADHCTCCPNWAYEVFSMVKTKATSNTPQRYRLLRNITLFISLLTLSNHHIIKSISFRAYGLDLGNRLRQRFSQYTVAVFGNKDIVFHAYPPKISERFYFFIIDKLRQRVFRFPAINQFGDEIQPWFDRDHIPCFQFLAQSERFKSERGGIFAE